MLLEQITIERQDALGIGGGLRQPLGQPLRQPVDPGQIAADVQVRIGALRDEQRRLGQIDLLVGPVDHLAEAGGSGTGLTRNHARPEKP